MRKTFSLKTAGIVSIICAFIFLFTSCKQEQPWKSYASAEGRFSVSFPLTPIDTVMLNGLLPEHEVFVKSFDLEKNVYYKVTWFSTDFVPQTMSVDPCRMTASANQGDMEAYASQMDGILRKGSRHVTMNGVDAEEFKVDFKSKTGVVTVRKLCTPKRVYTLLVISRAEHENNELVDTFFNSFKWNKS